MALALPAAAQSGRSVTTTPDSDYFGFDLRTEQNLSQAQCETTCIEDQSCRAFTYNTRAKWCFLKSDFNVVKPFAGAVAGKIVVAGTAPDIGAPSQLPFVQSWMTDEARQYRAALEAAPRADETLGLAGLVDAAEAALAGGDPRAAMNSFRAALTILPDEVAIWIALARAIVEVPPVNSQETAMLQRDGTSAALIAYNLSRNAEDRAGALSAMAVALEKREQFRPALQSYEASLALVDSAMVRAAYEDLKARKGFRVVEHTVDSDNAAPRVCAQFSEDLLKSGVDYTSFVTVDDAAPKSVEVETRQICVGGLSHGNHYRVSFRQGLPSAIGEVIGAPVLLSVYIQDRAATARFTGESFVLPSGGRRGIPMVTINMDEANLKLFRIGDRSLAQLLAGYQFLRQLDTYDISSVEDDLGAPVWEGKVAVESTLNKEVTTSIPVDEILPQRKPGVYVLTARPVDDRRDNYVQRATQWFVVSDIGITTYTGEDGLSVFARSLGSAKPLAGLELTLLARNNEVLGTATTNADGRAIFMPGLTRGTGGLVPTVLTAAQGDDDFVFLDMTRAGFDLSDRGVAGRASPGALDVYAWTERGIYRAGETVHVTALARDDTARAVPDLPLTFIFRRPDGVEDRRFVSDGRFGGGHSVDLPVAANAMLGSWSVAVYTDPNQPAVATKSFLVEDFVPDRIEFDLASDRAEIAAGETANVTVDGRFLYGAPAAGLTLEGELTLSTTRDWDRFKGYVFGLADEQEGDATRTPLAGLPVVGEDGKATFPVAVSQLPSTTRIVNADVTVRMREAGGRAVERDVDIAVRPQSEMIGIKPGFSGGEVPEGGTATFSVLASDASGNRIAAEGLEWSLVKIERNYQWYRNGNYWNYEPVTFTRAVSNGKLDVAADQDGALSMPVDWGRYRLEIASAEPDGPATSFEFDAGWYVAQTSTETPDGLEIALDKQSYAAGEKARLKVSPRFAGELLVTIGAERLLTTVTATVPEEGATIEVPVGADWGAGAYITATLFRPGVVPGEDKQSRMPSRSIGVKWLTVEPGAKKLDVALAAPEKVAPRGKLSIPVSVAGAAGADAYVTVAAVDIGILNLTRYVAPDPASYYFGQRMLGLEIRDLYGRLIDGSLGATGRLRTGGDGGGVTAQGSPPTEKLVALYSGPVKLDAEGKTRVEFELPQFNGSVRIMTVAWTADAVGHATQDVIVRDPVVVVASMPRFLAPGDGSELRLDITNTDGPAGDYALTVSTTGDLSTGSTALPEKVTLAAGARQALRIPLAPQATGAAGITVRLAHSGGTTVEQTLSIPVRPATAPVTTRLVVDLGPGSSLRVDRELLAASLLDGASVSVGVSPSAAFDVPSMLMTLDRYPYGCAEQTTSRALPLLYVSELSTAAGMADDPALKQRIQDAVYRVVSYQSSSGSFGLWSPGYGDRWLDAYVTDFLTRAREKNYVVPTGALNQALANLQNSLAYDQDVESRGSQIAYALYVLARNKKASVGDLRYYADTKLEAFTSPMAVAQLAASLALYGDTQRAEQTFEAAVTLASATTDHDWNRSDYGSRLRDTAAILALAAESRPLPKVVPQLVQMIGAERARTRWTSTQDEAWMLLAARALQSDADAMRLDVDGQAHQGAFAREIDGAALQARPLVLRNDGADPVQAVVTTVAAPATPLPAGGNGFDIVRTYYHLDGSEANVTEVTQNERFVVVLKLTEKNSWASRVLVQDLLPAGFEIDNPRLVSSADLASFPWLAQTETAHLEFRDDRFVAAFNREEGADSAMTLAYVVRAVTPGTYAHPAASVEDMYRPQFSARTASGVMTVRAP